MPKYRANIQVIWDFDHQSKDEAHQCAELKFQEVFKNDPNSKIVVHIDTLKEKIEKIKLAEYDPHDILSLLSRDQVKRDFTVNDKVYTVKMNSQRYFLFRESSKCVACGLQGTTMHLEQHPTDKTPHFNLYGVENNQLVLFTKDHIHAKSCGGEDVHSNYQTMCIICNNLKSHSNLNLEAVRILRDLYNKNIKTVSKKKLHQMIEDARLRLEKPWPDKKRKKRKCTSETIITISDLIVTQNIENEFHAQSIYDKTPLNYVGCIKKGTLFEPFMTYKSKYVCNLGRSPHVITIPINLVKIYKEEQNV